MYSASKTFSRVRHRWTHCDRILCELELLEFETVQYDKILTKTHFMREV